VPKLNDLQRLLLSNAAQRKDLSLLPFPDTVDAARAVKAVAGLIRPGLAEEVEIADPQRAWRSEGETNLGLRITPAGEASLALEKATSVETAPPPRVARASKATLVLQMMQRANGATLEELVQATGWLPHTTRAVLTGLRKKGHRLDKSKRDGLTCYRAGATPDATAS